MLEPCSRPGSADAGDLDIHMAEFIATLAERGYAEKTRRDKRRLIAPFIRWVREEEISAKDIDEACVDDFLACPARCRYKHHTALRQFVEHLRSVGVASQPRSEPSPGVVLCERYADHLRDRQGLSPHSIHVYSPFARRFIGAHGLPEQAAGIDAAAVRCHVLDSSRGRSASFVRLMVAAVRSFLRFCFLDGTITTDLSMAVPPVRRSQLASLPSYLTAEEVEQVIAAVDRSTTRGCRELAILLLLARLGFRASEVIALELDDIRWEAGEIVVRGKGRLRDRLPLLADVGEALALYLSTARGPSMSRRVFLSRIAPREGLSRPGVVSKMAREALKRAGLLPPGRVGAHIFRHSLATRMIRSGAALSEISQVLRHRSASTTELYTKVEFDGLRGVALPWPGGEAQG